MHTRFVPSDAAVAFHSPLERPAGHRIQSLDIIRGAVMVLMVLDHARVYLSNVRFDPTDLSKTSVALFLTRWVTHFCAPAFVFLAGTGAYLYGRRAASKADLSRYLLVRGLWLILIEMTIVRLGWTFNFDYGTYLLGGVIWMIGWCMILLAGLVWLPLWAIGVFGVAIIAGHNMLDWVSPARMASFRAGSLGWLWQILYLSWWIQLTQKGPLLVVLFTIFPWVGVMAAGYAFGAVMRMETGRRDRWCVGIGLGSIAVFLVLRGVNSYGDPQQWRHQPSAVMSVLSFVNASKYPASLLFLLMTLGPTILIIPFLERARGAWSRVLAVYGRVPFLFYVLHVYLVHLAAVVLHLVRYGKLSPWLRGNFPILAGQPPEGWGCGLIGVYLVAAAIAILLYWPCRAFARLKNRSRAGWLSFV